MKLVLGNKDYIHHTTDEGHQLQSGLVDDGWQIAGRGFKIDSVDVPEILDMVKPDIVFVQDVRDWDARSSGCYDRAVSFRRIESLAGYPAVKITVLKDAGSMITYQREFAERIGADILLHYYHRDCILAPSPWAANYELVRIYHTVDADLCRSIDLTLPRRRGVVSGAVSGVYPLRRMAFQYSNRLGIDKLAHPGYGNRGCRTPEYLRKLSRYKVHVATASVFGFALRKIIESVAMGCIPITNLPGFDVLPGIDDCLVRIPSDISVSDLGRVIDQAEREWDLDKALHYAEIARSEYDWKFQFARKELAA